MKRIFRKKSFNSWLIMLSCGLFYCYQFVLRVLPNTLSQEFMNAFHVEAAGFGLILAFYSASYATLQIPLGITIDRIKIKFLLPIAPLICALGALGMIYSDNIAQAATSRFLMGIGSALGFISAVKVATIILPTNRVSIGIGMTIFFGTLGAILGGRPLKMLSNLYGWQSVLLGIVFIGVIMSLVLFIALSSILIELKQGQAFLVKRPILKDLRLNLRNPQIAFLSIYGLLAYLPITILGAGWGIGFLITYFKVDYDIAANAIALMFMGAGIGSPIIAVLSEIFKSRKMMMLTSALLAFTLYALLLYCDLKIAEYQLYLYLFLVGFLYSAKTLSFALACDLIDKKSAALTTSVLNMTIMTSGLIFHPLIGFLLNKGHSESIAYTKYDYKVALSVLPISAIIAFIVILFIKDHKAEEDNLLCEEVIQLD